MSVACVTSSYGIQKEPSGRRSERCQQQNGHDDVPSQTPPIGLQRIDSGRRAAIGAIAAPVLPALRDVYQASLLSLLRSFRVQIVPASAPVAAVSGTETGRC
jgi:hypothetical protein